MYTQHLSTHYQTLSLKFIDVSKTMKMKTKGKLIVKVKLQLISIFFNFSYYNHNLYFSHLSSNFIFFSFIGENHLVILHYRNY